MVQYTPPNNDYKGGNTIIAIPVDNILITTPPPLILFSGTNIYINLSIFTIKK